MPDEILAKTSPLAPKEWLAIRKHPDIGADILAPIACLRECGIVDMVARGVKFPDLYLSCDKHWNAFGNAVAADILEPYVRAALQSAPTARGN